MDAVSQRGMRSSAMLLNESMSTGVQNLGRSKRIDSRSIPKTSSRVMLPLDAALQELSASLSESSFHQMMDDRPSTSMESMMSHPSVWGASAQGSVRRPWTSQGVGASSLQQPASSSGRRRQGQQRAAPTQSAEEVRLQAMLAEKESSLEQEGLGRAALNRDGLNSKQTSRLYRLLYLHSCSLQDVLLDTTDHCSLAERGPVLLKVWKVFVWLVEYLMAERASTQFSMALQQSSDAMSMLQERYNEEEARCDDLTVTLEEQTTRTHQLENEVRDLADKLEKTSTSAKTEANHKSKHASFVMEQAQSMLQEGDAYSQELYGQLAEERDARLQLQDALVAKGEEVAEVQNRLANTRRTLGPLETAGRQAQAAKVKAEAELVRTRAAISQLTAALTAERSSLHRATAEIEQLQAANATLTASNAALAGELEETQQKLTSADGLGGRFKARLALEKTRNAKLAQQLEESTTAVLRAEEAEADVVAAHEELVAAHAEATAERDGYRERAETGEARVEYLEETSGVMAKDLSKANKERKKLQQELDQMHAREFASSVGNSRAASPFEEGSNSGSDEKEKDVEEKDTFEPIPEPEPFSEKDLPEFKHETPPEPAEAHLGR